MKFLILTLTTFTASALPAPSWLSDTWAAIQGTIHSAQNTYNNTVTAVNNAVDTVSDGVATVRDGVSNAVDTVQEIGKVVDEHMNQNGGNQTQT